MPPPSKAAAHSLGPPPGRPLARPHVGPLARPRAGPHPRSPSRRAAPSVALPTGRHPLPQMSRKDMVPAAVGPEAPGFRGPAGWEPGAFIGRDRQPPPRACPFVTSAAAGRARELESCPFVTSAAAKSGRIRRIRPWRTPSRSYFAAVFRYSSVMSVVPAASAAACRAATTWSTGVSAVMVAACATFPFSSTRAAPTRPK